ncbi:putative kinase [Aeromicrobium sp. SORGH_AS981]|nr:putative kinase [Aeromicrobium sp. SORGH_AS_0981]
MVERDGEVVVENALEAHREVGPFGIVVFNEQGREHGLVQTPANHRVRRQVVPLGGPRRLTEFRDVPGRMEVQVSGEIEGPRLLLLCGLAGSGKSRRVTVLEDAGWVRFSNDREAYRRGFRRAPLPDDISEEIRARQKLEIERTLLEGKDVVVDYSLWSRRQRDEYRAIGAVTGAQVQVLYLDVPEIVLRDRLARRGGRKADDMLVSDDLLTVFLAGFEPPACDEIDVVVLDNAATESFFSAAPAQRPRPPDVGHPR